MSMSYFVQRWSTSALLPVRLIIGFGFAAHGYAKLAKGVGGFGEILGALGVPAALPTAWATALIELLGGLAIMAGAFVPIISVPLIVIMLTAIITVHFPYGFSTVKLMSVAADGPKFGTPGYEMNLLYIAGLVSLAIGGASPLSADGWLAGRRNNREVSKNGSFSSV